MTAWRAILTFLLCGLMVLFLALSLENDQRVKTSLEKSPVYHQKKHPRLVREVEQKQGADVRPKSTPPFQHPPWKKILSSSLAALDRALSDGDRLVLELIALERDLAHLPIASSLDPRKTSHGLLLLLLALVHGDKMEGVLASAYLKNRDDDRIRYLMCICLTHPAYNPNKTRATMGLFWRSVLQSEREALIGDKGFGRPAKVIERVANNYFGKMRLIRNRAVIEDILAQQEHGRPSINFLWLIDSSRARTGARMLSAVLLDGEERYRNWAITQVNLYKNHNERSTVIVPALKQAMEDEREHSEKLRWVQVWSRLGPDIEGFSSTYNLLLAQRGAKFDPSIHFTLLNSLESFRPGSLELLKEIGRGVALLLGNPKLSSSQIRQWVQVYTGLIHYSSRKKSSISRNILIEAIASRHLHGSGLRLQLQRTLAHWSK